MTPLHKIFAKLAGDMQTAAFWWQMLALGVALGGAWLLARVLAKRFAVTARVPLAFPLSALGCASLMRELAAHVIPTNLFDLALPLLAAFAAVRGAVYVLAQVFSASLLAVWERWVALAVWSVVALYFTGLGPALVATLEKRHLVVGKQKIALWAIAEGAFTIALTLLIALWLASALERRLLRAESLEPNGRLALARFGRALLVLLAVLASLGLAGIDLTVLSVFGGALGVGLGLGLQKIASNYVSGYIILLDKSIRIGDMVTVEKFTGTVTKITTRYSVLHALDGTEAIIPNETLLAQPVLNLSLTSKQVRVAIDVQVGYQSDLKIVEEILLDAARAHPRVLQDPPPLAFLRRFADSGIEFELGFWISDPENGLLPVKSDLHHAIWAKFVERRIEIPYPHRQIVRDAAVINP